MGKKEKVELIDRLGIGLVAAISFLFFHSLFYGLVILSISNPTPDVEALIVLLLKVFIWGPIVSFIIGFALLINPIEIILNLFDK